jgi:hypothetical protein
MNISLFFVISPHLLMAQGWLQETIAKAELADLAM